MQTAIPSPPRDWLLFRLTPAQHRRVCDVARRRRGSLGLMLYAAVHHAFPDVIPQKATRQVRWQTTTYMGLLHVKLMLPGDLVERIHRRDHPLYTVEERCMASLKKKFLRPRPMQANLFDAAT